jgi:hypothetical protein
MSLLSELNTIMGSLNIPVETGVFSGVPPDEYVVLTPLIDGFPLFGDNTPQLETQEVRISLFSKGNYRQKARQITNALLGVDITITERRYAGFDEETSYHNYAVDAANFYGMED